MKNILTKKHLFCLTILFSLPVYCQMQSEDNLKSFASRSLDTYLKNVIDKENFAAFGFKQYGEASDAVLGKPYEINYMGIEDLKKYEQGSDYKKIIINARKYWFPVMVNNEYRLRLEVIDKDGELIAGEFGGSRSMTMMGESSKKMDDMFIERNIQAGKVSIIQIPVMHILLFRAETTDGDVFVPASDMTHYNLEAGKAYSAEEIFSILKKYAKDIDPKIIR